MVYVLATQKHNEELTSRYKTRPNRNLLPIGGIVGGILTALVVCGIVAALIIRRRRSKLSQIQSRNGSSELMDMISAYPSTLIFTEPRPYRADPSGYEGSPSTLNTKSSRMMAPAPQSNDPISARSHSTERLLPDRGRVEVNVVRQSAEPAAERQPRQVEVDAEDATEGEQPATLPPPYRPRRRGLPHTPAAGGRVNGNRINPKRAMLIRPGP